jgi:hypothetical protein
MALIEKARAGRPALLIARPAPARRGAGFLPTLVELAAGSSRFRALASGGGLHTRDLSPL